MSVLTLALAQRLSAGGWHSGEAMAAALGCSRAAVWKHVGALRELGIAVEALAGQGYRLAEPLELLNETQLRSMVADSGGQLEGLRVLAETGSTNADLLARPPGAQHRQALFAERQTGGRGRRGRPWFSPFARNIYLSLGWRFESGLGALGFLPLVVAVATARACATLGLRGHGLKWPNDIVVPHGRDLHKLGGCLVEVRGDLGGPCLAVMGVGLNVHLRGAPGIERIDQAWTDLAGEMGGKPPSRNTVAAALLNELLATVICYEKNGFAPFESDWARYDLLQDRAVTLLTETGERLACARGLGPRGGILLEKDGIVEECLAGEARLRPVE